MSDDARVRSEVDASSEAHLSRPVPPAATRQKGIRGTIAVFLELVKFEHSVFALPYAYIGAIYGWAWVDSQLGFVRHSAGLFAEPFGGLLRFVRSPSVGALTRGWPGVASLVWITVAMVGARSFAFVVNRAVDKEIDARNPRTAGRAIPAGVVKAWELWLFALIVLAAYLFAASRLAPPCLLLSPIPLGAFVVYPYMKRFTPLCHYWLGLCLGLAAPAGWAAVGGSLAVPAPWVFGLAVMLWTAGFDMIYATQDIDCDRRDGIHSMPADYGIASALLQTKILHAATVILLVLGGYLVDANWAWYLGVAVGAGLLWWENAIISADDMSRVNAAFFTTNGAIAVILLVGAIADHVL